MSTKRRSQLDARAPASQSLQRLTSCERCPRLVAWREEVSLRKRAAYAQMPYWGAPVPPFGEDDASILLLGLAPGAHGANRTGRLFTGDSSAAFLVSALHRCGLSSQPTSTQRDDGLRLVRTRMSCAVRCVPPDNRPTRSEIHSCQDWLIQELSVLRSLRVIVALGALAWDAALRVTEPGQAYDHTTGPSSSPAARVPPTTGAIVKATARTTKPRFTHGAEAARQAAHGPIWLLGSYHPSQQNTFTGRLTPPMLDAVLRAAAQRAGVAQDDPAAAVPRGRPEARSRRA